MLSSDRLRTPHADDHDEKDLWERLRSEANRRSVAPASASQPPAAFDDYGSTFDSELPEEYASDSDLPPSPYESAQRFVQSSYPPPRQSYTHAQPDYSEAQQLAQYEAQHSEQYGEEQYEEQYGEEHGEESGEQQYEEHYSEQQAQQFAQEQYDLQRFSQPPQAQQFAQTVQQQFGQQPAHGTLPPGGFDQHYASQPPAAYGHVTPSAGEPAQQWGYSQQTEPTLPNLAADADDTGKSSKFTKPLAALAAVLAIGAAGYQFVLVPRQQQARAAELVELQQRQAVLIEQQEKETAAATARAEAEQKAAN
ncbi:MAG TPA: hypothetical protein VFX59_11680, partial [Polyangiales bacterium]|nr:hypothetical protein [Polyangiales bacterium]